MEHPFPASRTKRFAAHYILYGRKPCRLHYVEVAGDGTLSGVFPLTGEVERTEFHDGCIAVLPVSCTPDISDVLAAWPRWAGAVAGAPVRLCFIRLPHLSLTALLSSPEFGAGDCGGDGHVE